MSLTVNFLGCGSAAPSLSHLPSCQVVNHNGTLFLVDCGEGAQLSVRRMGLNFARIRHIFISHLHGDHLLGLPGLLSTLTLNDMAGEVHVYMFAEGIELLKRMMDVVAHPPCYDIVYHELKVEKKVVYEDKSLSVETFPLNHTIPAVGFLFREKPKLRKLRGDMAEFYNVPVRQRQAIKEGADFIAEDGRIIPNSWLTENPDPSASYAYCSDTIYNPGVVNAVKDVDVLYHEATYGDDKAQNAAARGHSTARQAGRAAAEAGAKKLIIGHYSSSYAKREDELLQQAKEEFPNTELAWEGKKIEI